MKKFFILCLMAIMACSCVTTKTFTETYYGKVTTFTPQGDTLQTWNNALIEKKNTHINTMYGTITQTTESAFKYFGLNFIDQNTGKGVIIHVDIPYIIEYQTNVEVDNVTAKQNDETAKRVKEIEKQYHNYQEQIAENKKDMKKLDKKSSEYQVKEEQNRMLSIKMTELEEEYSKLTD